MDRERQTLPVIQSSDWLCAYALQRQTQTETSELRLTDRGLATQS